MLLHNPNGGRTCELCSSRDGQLFDKDSVPLDHPNGMCTIVAVIPQSDQEIADELAAWANGKENPALDKWLKSAGKRDIITLTTDEQWALNEYISSGSYKINYPLRHGIPLSKEQTEMMVSLDSALLKMPTYQGTVYRSITADEINDIDEFMKQYPVGDLKGFPSYLSSGTTVYDESFPIQYVIESKTGRDIRAYNRPESEILFERDTQFRVKRVEGHTIYLEEA